MPGARFLRGDQVDLCVTEREDVDFIKNAVSIPEVRKYLDLFRQPYNRTRYEQEIFEQYDSTEAAASFVVCRGDDRVGSVQLAPISHDEGSANIGFWILPDEQGNGYATEAARLAVEYAFSELGLRRISAETLAPNDASRHVLENVGFRHEGTRVEGGFVDGGYVDNELYGLLRSEWTSS